MHCSPDAGAIRPDRCARSGFRTVPPTNTLVSWALTVFALTGCDGNGVAEPVETYRIAFIDEPTVVEAKEPMSPAVRVAVVDGDGLIVPGLVGDVSLTVANDPTDGDATLGGTTTAQMVAGVASFSDLTLDLPGEGYRLRASFSGSSPNGPIGPRRSDLFEVRLTFRKVVAAGAHTCGVTVVDHAYCWGRDFDGELGDSVRLETVGFSPRPVPVAGGIRFADLTAGSRHTCGLTGDGAAFCWGGGEAGSLGHGAYESMSWPVPVSGGHEFSHIDAGAGHTCALTTDRRAYCWGPNGFGYLGDGTEMDRSAPVAVSGEIEFTHLSAGGSHTCGLTPGGEAYCWGHNGIGQLGDGTTASSSVPVPVSGGIVFESIDLGGNFSCGLDSGGVAYCWGANLAGQSGTGVTTSTTPTAVLGDLAFDVLSAGSLHTCGIDRTGAAHCWGVNTWDQLGIGDASTTIPSSPVPVVGGHVFDWISAGMGDHTCAVSPGGEGYCWGLNGNAQIRGDGEISHAEPTVVGR